MAMVMYVEEGKAREKKWEKILSVFIIWCRGDTLKYTNRPFTLRQYEISWHSTSTSFLVHFFNKWIQPNVSRIEEKCANELQSFHMPIIV